MLRVVKQFVDLMDDNHLYHVNDVFPREGYQPSDARLNSLLGKNNKQKMPLIAEVEDKPESLNSATPALQEEVSVEQEDSPRRRQKSKMK